MVDAVSEPTYAEKMRVPPPPPPGVQTRRSFFSQDVQLSNGINQIIGVQPLKSNNYPSVSLSLYFDVTQWFYLNVEVCIECV